MNGTMLAARAHAGEHRLRLEPVPVPEPGPQDVLVRVVATGLGPGPVLWWQHGMTQPLPVTPGHEIAGTVVEVGSAVDSVRAGDRVRVHANLTCRDCVLCRTDREPLCARASILGGLVFGPEGVELNAPYHDGGLAEYVRVPAWLLDLLPDSLPFPIAARAHDVGVANRALKLASLEPGGVLVVLAATGAMGVATIRLAPLFGVARVVAVGRSRARLERVRALDPGLVEVIATEELPEGWQERGLLARAIRQAAPEGAQAVVDYLGDGRQGAAAALGMRNGGTLVLVGAGREPLPLPTGLLMANGLRVAGSRSCTRRDACEVLELLRTGRLAIDDLLTHRVPLPEVNRAVEELMGRGEGAWLITVDVGTPPSAFTGEKVAS
jgi:threonine dehydrogenase-like Zn-dependent dehydrogenase